jgi:hypothetical protein
MRSPGDCGKTGKPKLIGVHVVDDDLHGVIARSCILILSAKYTESIIRES